MTSSLIDLLKAFLRDYENIEDLYEQGNIYSLVSDLIHQERDEYIPIDTPEGYNDRDAFWRRSTSALLQTFNDNFKILETDEDLVRKETYLNFAENMKIIKNKQRIDVENINDNFKLIVSGLQMIIDELFASDGSNLNKYFLMFQGIYNELFPLWENVLYLWIAFLLKEREAIETPIVKYVYLNESDFINNRKFDVMSKDITDITIDDVIDKIECYIDEYPNSHLCIIPIIRLAAEGNRYGIEAYPGIFYHSPSFNSQLFKCQHKFMYYSFVDMGISESSIPFNPFYNGMAARFVEAGYQNTTNCLNLSNISYGYRIYGDHLYYAAPFSNISNIREIIPKKYYSAVRSFIDGEFFIYNGALGIYNFKIKYQDVVSNNINSNKVNIAYYEPVLSNANFIVLSLDDNLMTTDKRYILKDSIRLEQHKNSTVEKELTKIRNFRDRIGDTIGQHKFYFPYYEGECISGIAQSIEEDYSYLIEYIPLKYNQTSSENTHIRDSSYDNLNTYINSTTLLNPTSLKTKDNDLLEKHVTWDDARNNILEDKFVLRIGQHIETENAPSNSNLIPNEFKTDKKIKYFDYTSTLDTSIDEKETVNNVVYYNSGTTEVGAYLNIPFIKNPNKRLQFYPDFLSHNFGSDNLIPLTSVEYFNQNSSPKPEYFSYNKVFRDYDINKRIYFKIYTTDGKENFNNDDWCIQMIEVIGQNTPSKQTFFENNFNFETIKTTEELYQLWNSLSSTEKSRLTDENILLYISQMCPSKVSDTSSINKALGSSLYSEVKSSYQKIVNYFYSSATDAQKEQVYEQIYQGLFSTSFGKTDHIYHLIHEKSFDGNNDKIKLHGNPSLLNGGLQNSFANPKIQLGILSSSAPNNNSQWEETFSLENGQLKYTDELNSGTISNVTLKKEYFGYLKPLNSIQSVSYTGDVHVVTEADAEIFYRGSINPYFVKRYPTAQGIVEEIIDESIPDKSTIYFKYDDWEDINNNLSLNNEEYLYKETTTSYTMHYADYINGHWTFNNVFKYNKEAQVSGDDMSANYCIPQVQLKNNIKKSSLYSQEVYDESYKSSQYLNNKMIGSAFFAMGFCCACRTLPFLTKQSMHSSTDPVFENGAIQHGGYWDVPDSKVIRFEIFGTNIPLQMRYWNFERKGWGAYNLNSMGDKELATDGWAIFGASIGGAARIFKSYHKNALKTTSFINPTDTVWVKAKSVTGNEFLSQAQANTLASLNPKSSSGNNYDPIYYTLFEGSDTTLKPFYKLSAYPLLRYNYILNRQYPHIFLMSQKTLFPNKNYLMNIQNKNIIFKNRGVSRVNMIKDYFSNLQNSSLKLPYPFPIYKDNVSYQKIDGFNISWNQEDCFKQIAQNYRREVQKDLANFLKKDSALIQHGDSIFDGNVYSNYTIPYYDSQNQRQTISVTKPATTQIGFPNAAFFSWGDRQRLCDFSAYSWLNTNQLTITDNLAIGDSYQDIVYSGNNSHNVDSNLGYDEEKSIGLMNLQIIIHYFGPNGTYARKVMTRKLTNTTVTSDDHFVWDGTTNKLLYKEWTNNWEIEYKNQSTYNSFKNSLENKEIFKQSSSIISPSGVVYDFETYPNTGLSSEGSHQES